MCIMNIHVNYISYLHFLCHSLRPQTNPHRETTKSYIVYIFLFRLQCSDLPPQYFRLLLEYINSWEGRM